MKIRRGKATVRLNISQSISAKFNQYPSAGVGPTKQMLHVAKSALRHYWIGAIVIAILYIMYASGLGSMIARAPTITEQTYDRLAEIAADDVSDDTKVLAEVVRNTLWALAIGAGAIAALLGLGLSGIRSYSVYQQATNDGIKQQIEAFSNAVRSFNEMHDTSSITSMVIFYEMLASKSRKFHGPLINLFCAYLRHARPQITSTRSDVLRPSTPHRLHPSTRSIRVATSPALATSQRPARQVRAAWPLYRKGQVTRGAFGREYPAELQAMATAVGRRRRSLEGRDFRLELHGADMRYADLRGAHLEGADLTGAILSNARLQTAHLEGANLTGARLDDAQLVGAHLKNAILSHAVLTGANLGGASLAFADLSYAVLTETRMEEAFCRGANFNYADLTRAKLQFADCRFSTFFRAIMVSIYGYEINLSFAFMRSATLNDSNLTRANLSHADIASSDFVRANLTDAILTSAILHSTNLTGAAIAGADFRSCEGATASQIINAAGVMDHRTRWSADGLMALYNI